MEGLEHAMNRSTQRTKTMKNLHKTPKSGDAPVLPGVDESIVASPDGSKVKEKADWERIEVEYRAGMLSLREIAASHGITEGAIRQYAKGTKKRSKWERDLTEKIKVKADEILRTDLLRSTLRTETATEREVVDATASAVAVIGITQRKDIGRNRSLAMKLLEEMEASTDNKELFAQLGEIMSGSEEVSDSMKALYRKVVSMPARIDSMQKLANTMKVLIDLECKAYGIDSGKASAGDKLDDLLAMLDGKASSLLPE